MRKVAGALLAVAMVLPVGLFAPPAGAAASTTCTTLTGTVTLSPGLPILKSKARVKPTYTIKAAKLNGCTGGVTSGVLSAKLKQSVAGNCTTLLAGGFANIAGTATIVWNNKSSSTFTVKFVGGSKNVSQFAIPGRVTKGLFVGSKTSGTLNVAQTKDVCQAKPFSAATFKAATSIVI